MKLISLTQGKFTMIDDADYDAVSQFKWHFGKIGRRFCAKRNIRKPNGKQTTQYLHQFLMPGVADIDHINGDCLNNQRGNNLRPATQKQNSRGFCRKKIGTSSKYRGVSWHKQHRKWHANIRVDGKLISLGYFPIERDAARARDKATLKYYGPDAHFNFPI